MDKVVKISLELPIFAIIEEVREIEIALTTIAVGSAYSVLGAAYQ
jgi:hypothetical protein